MTGCAAETATTPFAPRRQPLPRPGVCKPAFRQVAGNPASPVGRAGCLDARCTPDRTARMSAHWSAVGQRRFPRRAGGLATAGRGGTHDSPAGVGCRDAGGDGKASGGRRYDPRCVSSGTLNPGSSGCLAPVFLQAFGPKLLVVVEVPVTGRDRPPEPFHGVAAPLPASVDARCASRFLAGRAWKSARAGASRRTASARPCSRTVPTAQFRTAP